MREIKFRAWMQRMDGTGKMLNNDMVNQNWPEILDDCAVMQYTGLKDKNGKEIYEGDIVADYEADAGLVFCAVEWDSREARFWLKQWSDGLSELLGAEVVGNIYENSDLLDTPIG